jgi:hypothetical protein
VPKTRTWAKSSSKQEIGDPANDWAALYEIADVIRKALQDPEFGRNVPQRKSPGIRQIMTRSFCEPAGKRSPATIYGGHHIRFYPCPERQRRSRKVK